MPILLRLLGWSLVLAVLQILLAAGAKRQQDGLEWAAGSRDGPVHDYTGLAGRLHRAQLNLFETLPLFAAAVLAVHAAARDAGLATMGAQIYFWCRLAYVPLYASGIRMVRSVVWGAAMVGLVMVLVALLR